jgi:hypothetical protein
MSVFESTKIVGNKKVMELFWGGRADQEVPSGQ